MAWMLPRRLSHALLYTPGPGYEIRNARNEEGWPMALISKTYGKGRVRVMRIHREGDWQEVRELTVKAMVEGNFAGAFTDADNSTSLCTDTVKNIVNIVAREELATCVEDFCKAVAKRLLSRYEGVGKATVTGHETVWDRLSIDGTPHPHAFTLNGNGKPFAKAVLTHDGVWLESGVSGFTFLKSTQSGWVNYIKEQYTTLAETDDRIAATALDASWRWHAIPADYAATNKLILETMLKVFATTYSYSVQDSLYRMGMAALDAVPEITDISLAAPNKHYLLANLAPFGMDNPNDVFVATDEPHGQIECVIGRG
jgi:urate oxidase